MATRRKELINLGTVKARRAQKNLEGFEDLFGFVDETPSEMKSTLYDGCAEDLVDFAGEVNIEANKVTLMPEEELAQLSRKGLYVMGDPVNRAMLEEADRQIVTNRGDVIGGELVDLLHEEHRRIQGWAPTMREYHFAPDQPLVSRYEQALRNEELLKRQVSTQRDLEGINEQSFWDKIDGDSPNIHAIDPYLKNFGPKISFKDPILGRTKKEEWLSAEDIWEAKQKEREQRGKKPVEIWGIQRASKRQLEALNAEWELAQRYPKNVDDLRFYRDQYKRLQKILKGTNNPVKRKEIQQQMEEIAVKGRTALKNVKQYASRNVVKPGDYDAPNGPWSLDDMQQRVFKSKAEAEGWIRANQEANEDVVFKPYRQELERIRGDSGERKNTVQQLRAMRTRAAERIRALKETKSEYVFLTPDNPEPGFVPHLRPNKGRKRLKTSEALKRAVRYHKSVTTRLKKAYEELREELGKTGKEFIALHWKGGWDGMTRVFSARDLDTARATYILIRKNYGVTPNVQWLNREQGVLLRDTLASQQVGPQESRTEENACHDCPECGWTGELLSPAPPTHNQKSSYFHEGRRKGSEAQSRQN